MLQVHLDCPFFIAPSVFSNVYLRRYVGYHQYPLIALTSDLKINFVFHNIRNVSESLSYDALRTTIPTYALPIFKVKFKLFNFSRHMSLSRW